MANLARALVVCAVAMPAAVHAADPRSEYELQERCGKRAEQVFRRDWGPNGTATIQGGQVTAVYRNHYHAGLNKCFVLYTSTTWTKGKKEPITTKVLFDVNESKEYGTYIEMGKLGPVTCEVDRRTCTNEPGWEALAARFMGD